MKVWRKNRWNLLVAISKRVATPVASPSVVIPALGAGIHALRLEVRKAWIPGPGMTAEFVRTNA
jgi:hypothetical protein